MGMKIPHVVSNFTSIQGEGKRSNRPCTFIRFFGCTLPGCPGFGQKDPADPSTWKKPVLSMEKAPEFGCDSPNSWYEPFKKYCKHYDNVEDLYNDTIGKNPIHLRKEIIITGGEPMIWQDFLIEFIKKCAQEGSEYFTIETNGMIGPKPEFIDYLENSTIKMLFSISPKLNCVAGVDESKSIQIDVLKEYLEILKTHFNIDCQFKYVVNEDPRALNKIFEIRDRILEGRNGDYEYFKELLTENTLLMPVGAWEHSQELKQKTAQICIENGFVYCPRIHVDVWGSRTGV